MLWNEEEFKTIWNNVAYIRQNIDFIELNTSSKLLYFLVSYDNRI